MIMNIVKKALVALAIVALVALGVWVGMTVYSKVAPMCANAAEPIGQWLGQFPGFNFK